MNHCPSHDWDTYYDGQEKSALDACVEDVCNLAEALLPAILSNPVQFTANMAAADMVEFAYEVAAETLTHRNRLQSGGDRYRSVPSASRKEMAQEDWADKFWDKWGEELLP